MKINGVKKITANKWLNLFEIDFTDNHGKANCWQMASRRAQPETAQKQTLPDAAVIIAWHAEAQKLVLLHEFRLILNGWQYAFPAGLLDPGEDTETSAARELNEETGLTLTRVLDVSPPLYSSAGLTDETISLVFAECTGTLRTLKGRSEEAETLLVSREEAGALLKDRSIAFDVRAWLSLRDFAANGWPFL